MSRTKLFLNIVVISLVIGNGYPGQCQDQFGFIKNVVSKVYGNSLSKSLTQGHTILKNQRIRTSRDSGTEVQFVEDSNLYVGELSDLRLRNRSVVSDSNDYSRKVLLKKGVLRYASRQRSNQNIGIFTPHARIVFKRGSVDIFANSGGTEIAVNEGVVEVIISSRSERFIAGQNYRISNTGETNVEQFNSLRMKDSVAKMLEILKFSEAQSSASANKIKESKDKNIQPVVNLPDENKSIQEKDLRNILYMDLTFGRVIIEMLPIIAPNHVKRIKKLVRQRFYDGLGFHNVIEGFVAETGDPTGTGLGGSGTTIKAELTKTAFTRGLVGMKHDRNNLNSADSQFFILLGDAKHLEGKYTAWGRVIYGMLLLDRIRKGSPPENPDYILKLRVAVDSKD